MPEKELVSPTVRENKVTCEEYLRARGWYVVIAARSDVAGMG